MTVPAPASAFDNPGSLAFAQAGEGPDVILIHGVLTSLDDMAIALFDTLKDEFRVTAFDRPGHGGTGRSANGSPRAQAAAVRASARALGLRRPVVVGHSFGGAVALAYGLDYPDEIAGVVALSPIAFPEPRLEQVLFTPRTIPGPLGFWSRAMTSLFDPVLLPILWRAMFLPQDVPERFAERFPFARDGRPAQLLAEGQDAAWMGPGVAWNAAMYPSCRAPVHVLAGDRDLVINGPGSRPRAVPHDSHRAPHYAAGARSHDPSLR